MNAYQKKGRGVFFQRITLNRRSIRASCGTDDPAVKDEVVAMIRGMKRRREFAPLTAILDKRTTLRDVFDHYLAGDLDGYLARLDDPDLDALVTRWEDEGADPRYVRQVRGLIVKGQRFPASDFRKGRISAYLSGLAVQDPTRKRYRSALSVFARWLVELDLIEFNPVRDARRFSDNPPRTLWMSLADAQRVVRIAHQPYRALFAILYGSGCEIGAALPLTAADIAESDPLWTLRARGTKTHNRNRVIRLEAWALPHVTPLLRGKRGPTALFHGIDYDKAYLAHAAALRLTKLKDTGFTMHDARHTYAVNALKAGYDEQVVAHQLGHKDASMIRRIYGRFVPDDDDYRPRGKRGGRHLSSHPTSRKPSHGKR